MNKVFAQVKMRTQEGDRVMCTIYNRVSEVMGREKKQIADVAKEAELRHFTVRTLFYGEAKGIQFKTLAKLCRVLNCTPNDLFEFIDGLDSGKNGDA